MAGEQSVIERLNVRTLQNFLCVARVDPTTGHDVKLLAIAGVHQHQSGVGSVKQLDGLSKPQCVVSGLHRLPSFVRFSLPARHPVSRFTNASPLAEIPE
jgi:hypothetical protein